MEGPSPIASAAELELRGVSKRYPGQLQPAISELSLTVPAGDVCVLVGPSGSGKTTAMRLINRMIPITGGDILLGGESVLHHDPRTLRRQIGYVIQQIGLFPHRTIEENIATVPRLLGWPKERIATRVSELFDLIGLDHREMSGRFPAQLSGGQRQRVGVARALAADPPLMLMDEPFGAIDPINRSRLQDEFLRLQQQVRKTVVFVTHDVDEAIKMGDRIAILREGGVLAQYDTPAEILRSPADDFVAQFVGADRGIKRLSLLTVADVKLLAPERPARDGQAPAEDGHARAEDGQARAEDGQARAEANQAPAVASHTSLRDALSILMSSRADSLAVLDERGRVHGRLTLELLHHTLADDDGASGAHPSAATTAAAAPAEDGRAATDALQRSAGSGA